MFQFHPNDVRESRAEMIERRFGGENPTYSHWLMAIQKGEARARRVLLWHLLNLKNPTLSIRDVDPYRDEVQVEYTKDELAELIDKVRRAKRMDPEKRERAIEALEDDLAMAPYGDERDDLVQEPDLDIVGEIDRVLDLRPDETPVPAPVEDDQAPVDNDLRPLGKASSPSGAPGTGP